jgi:hypothetical protein
MILAGPSVHHSGHRLRSRMCGEPQRSCSPNRIKPGLIPPAGFIAVTMELAMVTCKFITDFAVERPIFA